MISKNYKTIDSREFKQVNIPVATRPAVTTEEVVNDDGVLVRSSKSVIFDASKEINIYKVSDFTVASLAAAGVSDLSPVSFSRSSVQVLDNIPEPTQP